MSGVGGTPPGSAEAVASLGSVAVVAGGVHHASVAAAVLGVVECELLVWPHPLPAEVAGLAVGVIYLTFALGYVFRSVVTLVPAATCSVALA